MCAHDANTRTRGSMSTNATNATNATSASTDLIMPYGPAAQGLLPLAGLVVCPLLCFFIYRYTRRRFEGKETLKSRAFLFYRMMGGIFLGQFVCHTFLKGTTYSVLRSEAMAVFVLAGYIAVTAAVAIARVCGPNKHVSGPRDEDVEDDLGFNKETMEQEDYVKMRDLGSPVFGHKMHTVGDTSYDDRKRRWILALAMFTFIFIAIVDGLFLVYKDPQTDGAVAAIVVCFYINKMAQTVALCGTMVHAKIQEISGTKTRIFAWTFLTAAWSLCVFLSTLPVLVQTPLEDVAAAIAHPALAIFFAMAAGSVLWMVAYYMNQKLRKIDRKDTVIGIFVLMLAAGQSAVTAFYL
jgi:hypothetical protein